MLSPRWSPRRLVRWLGPALVVAACSNPTSRLDSAVEHRPAGDPWSGVAAATNSNQKPQKDGDGGIDLQQLLGRVIEGLEKPGPYEAPEASVDFNATKPYWGVLDLDGNIGEQRRYSWRGGSGTSLRELTDRLRELAKTPELAGVLLRLQSIDISLTDALELRGAMHELRSAGKKLACHTEDASNTKYLILTACDRIGLAPLGHLMINGPSALQVHVKSLLDKLGVQPDFLHVGAYKGAAEPLTREAPSREAQETLNAILDLRYETMVGVIADERRLDQQTVRALIDTAVFTADDAKNRRLVDDVLAFEGFRDAHVKAPWTDLKVSATSTANSLGSGTAILRFLGTLPPAVPTSDHVALVYATGNIIDGEGSGVLGAREEIAAHTLVAALRSMADDATVKAVVLRIDSGGGSAQAAELIWRAAADLKAKKPVVVSMGAVAASGGYYIASGASKIFANANTLTGSIGVVGGKLAPAQGLGKIGVRMYPIGRGKRATISSNLAPWTDDERSAIMRLMDDVYRVFVGRVATGRGKTVEQVLEIAQGRVWTGQAAKQLGLVDELGGLDAALAEARRLGNVATTELEVYPPPPTLRDLLLGLGGGVQLPFELSAEALATLDAAASSDPALATSVRSLVDLVLSFRTTPLQAVTVVPVIR